jgi:hypothetical protein
MSRLLYNSTFIYFELGSISILDENLKLAIYSQLNDIDIIYS